MISTQLIMEQIAVLAIGERANVTGMLADANLRKCHDHQAPTKRADSITPSIAAT
jgi:hypothetical protein